jgi:hypothetical protein
MMQLWLKFCPWSQIPVTGRIECNAAKRTMNEECRA